MKYHGKILVNAKEYLENKVISCPIFNLIDYDLHSHSSNYEGNNLHANYEYFHLSAIIK